jgi:GLPGLI family protein
MKQLIYITILLVSTFTFGQINYKITYLKSSNGTLIENQDPILVFAEDTYTTISSESIESRKATYPYEKTLIKREQKNTISQSAYLNERKTIYCYDSLSINKQTFELLAETKKILGYNCKKAKTIINSNTIELWYTTDLKIKGAPSVLGQNLGLVLETNRNGNFIVSATKIEKLKPTFTKPTLISTEQDVDNLTYK